MQLYIVYHSIYILKSLDLEELSSNIFDQKELAQFIFQCEMLPGIVKQ